MGSTRATGNNIFNRCAQYCAIMPNIITRHHSLPAIKLTGGCSGWRRVWACARPWTNRQLQRHRLVLGLDFAALRAVVAAPSAAIEGDAPARRGILARLFALVDIRDFSRGLLQVHLTSFRVAFDIEPKHHPRAFRDCLGIECLVKYWGACAFAFLRAFKCLSTVK